MRKLEICLFIAMSLVFGAFQCFAIDDTVNEKPTKEKLSAQVSIFEEHLGALEQEKRAATLEINVTQNLIEKYKSQISDIERKEKMDAVKDKTLSSPKDVTVLPRPNGGH
jgi:phage-related minor tail protein